MSYTGRNKRVVCEICISGIAQVGCAVEHLLKLLGCSQRLKGLSR